MVTKPFCLISAKYSGFRVLFPSLQVLLQINFSDHYVQNLSPQLPKGKTEIKSSLIKWVSDKQRYAGRKLIGIFNIKDTLSEEPGESHHWKHHLSGWGEKCHHLTKFFMAFYGIFFINLIILLVIYHTNITIYTFSKSPCLHQPVEIRFNVP